MTSTRTQTYDLDLRDPAFLADPYPAYEGIRRAGRAVWNPALNAWMITGYEDCAEVLSDSSASRFRQVNDPEQVFWFDAPNMITVDGTEHQRLRTGLKPYFTRRAIAKLEARIGAVVDGLLRPLASAGEFELAEFTMIPTVVVAEMFGVPDDRLEDFRRWSNVVTGNVSYGLENAAIRGEMMAAVRELNDYLAEEITRHRSGEFDDLLTAMLGMSEMTEAEMRSSAVNILLAGYDTTAKLLSMCLVALDEHPDQKRIVAGDPRLIPAMAEEVLRWSTIAQVLRRHVTTGTTMAGTHLAAGDTVYLVLGAANRDPSRWPHPDRFDVSREQRTHLGFGHGAHLCLGIHLARLEVKVALERLLAAVPDFHLRDITFHGTIGLRGPDSGKVVTARHGTSSRPALAQHSVPPPAKDANGT